MKSFQVQATFDLKLFKHSNENVARKIVIELLKSLRTTKIEVNAIEFEEV